MQVKYYNPDGTETLVELQEGAIQEGASAQVPPKKVYTLTQSITTFLLVVILPLAMVCGTAVYAVTVLVNRGC